MMEFSKSRLPYNYLSLTWDSSHLSNEENVYCYCGGPGEWCVKMLQCHQCKQWFHEKCIRCFEKETLYFGDRFFLFLCSVCCKGPEILRRLELSWLDVVHLVIYNMTVIENKTYFDINESVYPTVARSLALLQLPREFLTTTKAEREQIILNVLRNNRRLFKSGHEIRKRSSLWGLRSRAPPTVPDIHVNIEKLFAEKLTFHLKKKLDMCRTSSLRRSGRGEEIVETGIPKFVLTEPKNYQTLLPTPPPEDLTTDYTFKKIRQSLTSVLNVMQGRKRPRTSIVSNHSLNEKAKPQPKEAKEATKMVARKGATLHGKHATGSTNSLPISSLPSKQPTSSEPAIIEDSLLGTLETLIPTPATFTGMNNPFYLPTDQLMKKRKNRAPAIGSMENPYKRHCTRSSAVNGSTVKLEPSHNLENHGLTKNGQSDKVNSHSKLNSLSNGAPNEQVAFSRVLRNGPNWHANGDNRMCAIGKQRSSVASGVRLNRNACRILACRRSIVGKVQYLFEWNKTAE